MKKQLKIIKKKYENISWAEFKQQDLIQNDFFYGNNWDLICSFEVLEHVGKENIKFFMQNLKKHCDQNTIVLISTPVFDEKVGAAENHIINGIIGELTYIEMLELINDSGFKIKNKWGTFASIKDYKEKMNDWQYKFYEFAKNYFDVNILSNLMAPLFPEYSRNILWELSI